MVGFVVGGRYTQSILTNGGRRTLNAKKTVVHDDVTHCTMAR